MVSFTIPTHHCLTLVSWGQRTNPLMFAAGAAVFVTAAFAASYIPAMRATRVDPMVTLR